MLFRSWKNGRELLSLCKFATAKRREISNDKLESAVNKINETYGKSVYLLSTPCIEISSTEIRNRVKSGKSIKYYVTNNVETYIRKNNIYR